MLCSLLKHQIVGGYPENKQTKKFEESWTLLLPLTLSKASCILSEHPVFDGQAEAVFQASWGGWGTSPWESQWDCCHSLDCRRTRPLPFSRKEKQSVCMTQFSSSSVPRNYRVELHVYSLQHTLSGFMFFLLHIKGKLQNNKFSLCHKLNLFCCVEALMKAFCFAELFNKRGFFILAFNSG